MFLSKRIAVVMPAHNEAGLIVRAVEQVPEFVDHLIVVDDASIDDTTEILKTSISRRGLICLRHQTNLGVGGAIVTGYRTALGLDADIVAVMAGDAQMDPDDLPRLLEPVARGEADYAKGDRLSWPGVTREMPLLRFIGNHALSRLTRISSGYRDVHDSQCGYTAISREALSRVDLGDLYQRYGFPNDMLAELHASGARLKNVVVRPIYGAESSEISLATALIRVPLVLLRSLKRRREKERRFACKVELTSMDSTKGL